MEIPFQSSAEVEVTSSQPIIKEEEEIVEVLDSKDNFEVFNQLQSPEAPISDFSHLPSAQVSQTQEDPSISEAMGLQRKTRMSLLGLLESHAGGNILEKAIQPKPPTLPPT